MDNLEQLEENLHIWVVNTDVSDATFSSLQSNLSPEEMQRAHRFVFEKDRVVYTVVHGALRLLLEHYLQRPASSFSFESNAFGKPYLKQEKLEFNLSHSGEIGLCAFSRNSKIGVDVERTRNDINLVELATKFFSKLEVKDLLETKREKQLDAFYRCWTRKEAFIKAHGKGLSIPLDSFTVPIGTTSPTVIESRQAEDRCVIHPFEIKMQGYQCALAYFGDISPIAIQCWNRWNSAGTRIG